MDILNATRPAARVERLQGHLQNLLRITAADWGLATLPARRLLPQAQAGALRATAAARLVPTRLRA